MALQLHDVIPEPLAGRIAAQHSDIWGRQYSLNDGEKVLFRAPSGKGKSTFIHILYGLRQDYQGKVSWDGNDMKLYKEEALASLRSRELSIVFQDLRLFSELTVEENLAIKQSLTRIVPMSQVKEWTEELGLEGKWYQKAGTLSYGEKQRVAIVRSLLQPFKWLLLDEPFSHLDNENIQRAAALIYRQVQQYQAGMIVVDLEDNEWFPYTGKMLL